MYLSINVLRYVYKREVIVIFTFNKNNIKTEANNSAHRGLYGMQVPLLEKTIKMLLWNIFDEIKTASAKELGHYILYKDRWINNRHTSQNTISYRRGEILEIDLGGGNFRSEPSFCHPCVVLDSTRDFLWIVPGSSKSHKNNNHGRTYRDVIDAEITDGFTVPTGLQMYATRWVNKNRVTDRKNVTVSIRILNLIDGEILKKVPRHHQIISQLNRSIATLTTANQQLAIDKQQAETDKQLAEAQLQTLQLEKEQSHSKVQELDSKNKRLKQQNDLLNAVVLMLKQEQPDVFAKLEKELAAKGINDFTATGF